MKLHSQLLARAARQLHSDPISDEHPVMPQLKKVYGDHTFFIGDGGLHIVESGDRNEIGEPTTGNVVRIARWSDAGRSNLALHQRVPTGIIIILAAESPNTAA